MTIKGTRQALCDAVDAAEIVVGGDRMTCLPRNPDDVEGPAFIVFDYDIDPVKDFSGLTDANTFTCLVLVPDTDSETGQEMLDDLLERTGPTSVRAAIMAAAGAPGEYALGGACDDINITNVTGYGRYTYGTRPFYGAKIRVFTIGAGAG